MGSMFKICFLLSFSLVLFSCKKNGALFPDEKGDQPVTGSWKLMAFRSYSYPPRIDTSWIDVNSINPVIIKFSNDSNFYYSGNYRWKMEDYNRYAQIDSLNYRIYSTNPPSSGDFPHYPSVFVKKISPFEIRLTYMGVDAGEEEKYQFFK
jgi:hypothetical protein